MSQLDWKKLAENLSGPGALSGCMENRAVLISRSEGMAISISLVASEIHGDRAWRTNSDAGGFVDSKMPEY